MDKDNLERSIGVEFRARAISTLPYYYQQLGRLCEATGLLDTYYEMVEADIDFGPAKNAIYIDLTSRFTKAEIENLFASHDIPSGFDTTYDDDSDRD